MKKEEEGYRELSTWSVSIAIIFVVLTSLAFGVIYAETREMALMMCIIHIILAVALLQWIPECISYCYWWHQWKVRNPGVRRSVVKKIRRQVSMRFPNDADLRDLAYLLDCQRRSMREDMDNPRYHTPYSWDVWRLYKHLHLKESLAAPL